jgi:hypothetical protein
VPDEAKLSVADGATLGCAVRTTLRAVAHFLLLQVLVEQWLVLAFARRCVSHTREALLCASRSEEADFLTVTGAVAGEANAWSRPSGSSPQRSIDFAGVVNISSPAIGSFPSCSETRRMETTYSIVRGEASDIGRVRGTIRRFVVCLAISAGPNLRPESRLFALPRKTFLLGATLRRWR